MTRWDSPLFTVPFDDATPPSEEIWEAMIGSDGKLKIVKPNQATVLVSSRLLVTLFRIHVSTNITPAETCHGVRLPLRA